MQTRYSNTMPVVCIPPQGDLIKDVGQGKGYVRVQKKNPFSFQKPKREKRYIFVVLNHKQENSQFSTFHGL